MSCACGTGVKVHFHFQLLANENRQPCNEVNGVIERRLSGAEQAAQQAAAQQQNAQKSTPKSERRYSNPNNQGEYHFFIAIRKLVQVEQPVAPRRQSMDQQAQPRIQATKVNQPTSKPRRNGSFGMVQQAGGSNLEKSRRMTGSTPNLSQAQLSDRYQTGFDTTPAERAQQLKKARG